MVHACSFVSRMPRFQRGRLLHMLQLTVQATKAYQSRHTTPTSLAPPASSSVTPCVLLLHIPEPAIVEAFKADCSWTHAAAI